jgi:hypothetical protein
MKQVAVRRVAAVRPGGVCVRGAAMTSGGKAWFVAVSIVALSLSSAAWGDDARTARLRLLCAQISGDLTDPGGLMQFRRCLNSRDPVAAMRQNALPPRRRMPRLVARSGVALTAGAGASGARAPQPSAICRPGLVWREATPTDHVCVTPATRARLRGTGRTH